jgi:hypothetical protein
MRARRRQCEQAIDVSIVAEIGDVADGATGLAEHLKALAIDRRVRRQRVLERKKRHLLKRDWSGTLIDDLGAAATRIPRACQLDRRRCGFVVGERGAPRSARERTKVEAALYASLDEARA